MKKYGIAFLVAVVAVATMSTSAENLKLPSGKVLVDPYVISKRPNGLEIGHKDGAMFVPFKKLPKAIQEKYKYDPAKAKAYEKQVAARKRALAAKKKAEAEKKAKITRELNESRFKASVEKLAMDIRKTELRIKFLKEEIPKLEKEANLLLDKTTSLAGKKVSSGRKTHYNWDGGFYVSGNNNSRAENTKRKTVKKLGEEYYAVKRKLAKYQKELETKELDIVKMKQVYKSKKERLKK